MAQYCMVFFLSFLVTLAAIGGIHGVDYVVTNTARNTSGGIRFDKDIECLYGKQALISATKFIWRLFRENDCADKKNVQKVSLFIDDMDGVAYASDNEIHVSARYINGYSGDLKREFTGVIYHETTHIWQWDGKGLTPGGLIEGIADFVRLKAGYVPSHWVQAGKGDKWDHGYDVTARFLDYCNSLRNGFVADLNKKMKSSYNSTFFVELLGKSVDQLWSDYKAKYGN
ncbi:hypothetical protein FH972_004593 [Carpinus fangiana]|uniref:Uncharacterized protein n=1 Tax=Carpinus fangiana TaxID=176857 RepID=A0A5N6QLR3_9ROSI|nr:hypothetical protein FH972_004593 [Carpinus fangiana]